MTSAEAVRLHFERAILPALRDYQDAEQALTAAWKSSDGAAYEEAVALAERRARTAAMELHHLGDAVAKNPPLAIGPRLTPRQARDWAESHCRALRTESLRQDLNLLSAITDAYKHWTLDSDVREIKAASDLEVSKRGFGKGPYGEGKFGGVPQVWIFLKDGKLRPLSSVLQNVTDAWRVAMGWPVPALSDYSE